MPSTANEAPALTRLREHAAQTDTLEEYVAFFSVLTKVKALDFITLADTQAHDRVQHLEKDKRAHHGDYNGGSGALRLIDELLKVPFEPTPGSRTSRNAPSRKHSG
jgi:hypothetical protein